MKKLVIILLLINFLGYCNYIFCQNGNDALLLKLEKELFPFRQDSSLIDIAKLCEEVKVDSGFSTYFLQPDYNTVSNVLREIAFSRNGSMILSLERIEAEYIAYLRKDWEPLLRKKIGKCKMAREKILILQCIEETLLSLRFAKREHDAQNGFEYYKDIQKRWYRSINDDINGNKAFEGFTDFSPYYLTLLKDRVIGVPVLNFDFMEPYFNTLSGPLIAYLNSYYSQKREIEDMEIEGYIFFRTLNVVNETTNPALLERLINLLITNENINKTEVARNVITILKQSPPNGMLEKRIVEELQKPKGVGKMNALLASSYVFKPEFIDVLVGINDKDTLTDEEKEYLKKVFKVIVDRPYVSDSQREILVQLLKE